MADKLTPAEFERRYKLAHAACADMLREHPGTTEPFDLRRVRLERLLADSRWTDDDLREWQQWRRAATESNP